VPGAGRARSQPDGRDHRQPKRQKRGKRGRCIDPSGYDAGKKIKGKKRHVLVDTQGLLMQAILHAADIQDRDGGVLLMGSLFGLYPFLLKLYADGGYQGPTFQAGLRTTCAQVNVEIVKRSDQHRFVVLPKRWIVERTIAWLNRCRRLARDWECLNRRALAFLR
jgi:transposase